LAASAEAWLASAVHSVAGPTDFPALHSWQALCSRGRTPSPSYKELAQTRTAKNDGRQNVGSNVLGGISESAGRGAQPPPFLNVRLSGCRVFQCLNDPHGEGLGCGPLARRSSRLRRHRADMPMARGPIRFCRSIYTPSSACAARLTSRRSSPVDCAISSSWGKALPAALSRLVTIASSTGRSRRNHVSSTIPLGSHREARRGGPAPENTGDAR